MYMFTRRARLSGSDLRDAIAWATEATQRVSQVAGVTVSLWMRQFSPDVGTIAFGTFVPDLATLEAANDKMMVDDGMMRLYEKGNDFILPGSVSDRLATVITGEPDLARPIEYTAVVEATMAAGKLEEGIAVGMEIAQRAAKITSVPTMFLAGTTGNYGSVAWLTGYVNVVELDRAGQALNQDHSFVEFLDKKARGVYNDTPGATTQVVYRRIPT
ncbi:MAG TPA: hypothetical protein VMU14_19255 [Acidimicrobiales bacterium]|nr:hypothetical protein [Acidimicrobiales bacterium]